MTSDTETGALEKRGRGGGGVRAASSRSGGGELGGSGKQWEEGAAEQQEGGASHQVVLRAVAAAQRGRALLAAALRADAALRRWHQRQALGDGDAVRAHAVVLGWVVGQQRDGAHAQVAQDVRRHAVVARIHLRGGKRVRRGGDGEQRGARGWWG